VPRAGEVGELVLQHPNEEGLYGIRFSDDMVEYFHRQQFELREGGKAFSLTCASALRSASEVWSAAGQPLRPGQWHDRLTGHLLRGTVCLWVFCVLLLLLLPTDVLADDDGYMKLHLVANSDATLTMSVTGLVMAIQFACLAMEGLIRFVTWAVQRCLLLFIYASF